MTTTTTRRDDRRPTLASCVVFELWWFGFPPEGHNDPPRVMEDSGIISSAILQNFGHRHISDC